MGNRPQEGQPPWKYHKVARPGEAGMQKWIGKDCDPSGMVSLCGGSPDSWTPEKIAERGDEYMAILRQMADRRFRQPADYELLCRAHELYKPDDQGHRRSQEEIAVILGRQFGRSIYQKDVSRFLREFSDWSDFVSGDSTSVGPDYKRQPPFIRD